MDTDDSGMWRVQEPSKANQQRWNDAMRKPGLLYYALPGWEDTFSVTNDAVIDKESRDLSHIYLFSVVMEAKAVCTVCVDT